MHDLANNQNYNNRLNALDEYCAVYTPAADYSNQNNVQVDSVKFYFDTTIYQDVTDSMNGYAAGTRREYNFTAKVTVIDNNISLSGEARGKGNGIANDLKTEIENRFQLKMEGDNGKYYSYQDNGKCSFAIICEDDQNLDFYVAFNKVVLMNLLSKE